MMRTKSQIISDSQMPELKNASELEREVSEGISVEACRGAINFVSKCTLCCVKMPRVGPSVLGGVALQWEFGDIHFMVRIDSEDITQIHFQREGPDFHQLNGISGYMDVIDMLIELMKK